VATRDENQPISLYVVYKSTRSGKSNRSLKRNRKGAMAFGAEKIYKTTTGKRQLTNVI